MDHPVLHGLIHVLGFILVAGACLALLLLAVLKVVDGRLYPAPPLEFVFQPRPRRSSRPAPVRRWRLARRRTPAADPGPAPAP